MGPFSRWEKVRMRATDRRTALLLALTLALSYRERGGASRRSGWSKFVPNSIAFDYAQDRLSHKGRGDPRASFSYRGNPL
jgi:hypothetical protein